MIHDGKIMENLWVDNDLFDILDIKFLWKSDRGEVGRALLETDVKPGGEKGEGWK